MVGCCCDCAPCASNRLFREDGKNLPALTLTLESRQSWFALDPALCDYLGGGVTRAVIVKTTVFSTQTLTLTKQWPVPSEVYDGLRSNEPATIGASQGSPTDPCIGYTCDAPKGNGLGFLNFSVPFFNPAYGWYVSESVPYGSVSGDAFWTGDGQPTGRYFLGMLDQYQCNCNPINGTTVLSEGPYCVFGFMFDEDVGSYDFPYPQGDPPQSLLKTSVFLSSDGALRGVEFGVSGGGTSSCYPYLRENSLFYKLDGIVALHLCVNPDCSSGVDENGNCLGGTTDPDPAPEPGLYPVGHGSVPPEITALIATHACEEMLWMNATISEA